MKVKTTPIKSIASILIKLQESSELDKAMSAIKSRQKKLQHAVSKELHPQQLSSTLIVEAIETQLTQVLTSMPFLLEHLEERMPATLQQQLQDYKPLYQNNCSRLSEHLLRLSKTAINCAYNPVLPTEYHQNPLESLCQSLKSSLRLLLQNADYLLSLDNELKGSQLKTHFLTYLNDALDFLNEAHDQLVLNAQDEIPPTKIPQEFTKEALSNVSQ